MKKLFIASFVLTFAFAASCSEDAGVAAEATTPTPSEGESQTIVINAPSIPTTKIAFEDLGSEAGIDIQWTAGDVITIYGEDGIAEDFTAVTVAADGKSATFSGDGLVTGDSYTAVYPASTAATLADRDAEELASQTINGATLDHLDNVCRMNDTFVYGTDDVVFEHEMAVMSIEFLMYENAVPTKYNFVDGDTTYSISFTGLEEAESYTATFMIYPNSGERLLQFKDNVDTDTDITQLSSVEYKAGYRYSVNLAEASGAYFMIGQLVEGGVVFYVDPDDRTSAKVMSLDDANPTLAAVQWSSDASLTISTDDVSDQSYDGVGNTNYISTHESYGDGSAFAAVKFCVDMGEGWYLPARSELKLAQVYNNPYFINGLAVNGGDVLGASTATIWSSSIATATTAWSVRINDNNHGAYSKAGKARHIRCTKQVTK